MLCYNLFNFGPNLTPEVASLLRSEEEFDDFIGAVADIKSSNNEGRRPELFDSKMKELKTLCEMIRSTELITRLEKDQRLFI